MFNFWLEKLNGSRPPASLFISLAISLTAFVLFATLEEAAGAASYRDQAGLQRGDIVDRNGKPLAFTTSLAGRPVRHYSDASINQTIGFKDWNGHWHGLENRYSGFLDSAGTRPDLHSFLLHLSGRSVAGGRVRLTIDRKVQHTADTALGKNKGAVVAIEPQTGDVLALVSKPFCSGSALATLSGYRACQANPSRPLEDRALRLLLPPGSAFKIVTLTAAFDTRRFGLHTIFRGANAFGPSPYFDNQTYPSNVTRADLSQLTLLQALAFSDNFAFAHIGLEVGGRNLLMYAHRYFIGRQIPFTYPVAPSVIANGRLNPSLQEVAQSAFGGEVDRVTPMQMALIAATVANGGIMMAPHLIKDLEGRDGRVTQVYQDHVLSHVMRPETANQLATAMMFVVNHGSGYRAQIPGLKVAGKTGTAASHAYYPHAWFICFAPARHPLVAVAVLHQFSGEGFKYAAPIARKVLISALRQRGLHVH